MTIKMNFRGKIEFQNVIFWRQKGPGYNTQFEWRKNGKREDRRREGNVKTTRYVIL